MRKEVKSLKNHTHLDPDLIHINQLVIGNFYSFDEDLSGGRLLLQVQAPQKSTLSRTAGSYNTIRLSLLNLGGDSLQNPERTEVFL